MTGKPTLLVTGGTGYIGSHIVHLLAEKGFDTVVIDNLSNSRRDAIPSHIPFYSLDVADTDGVTSVLREHKIDAVIHMAAFLSVEESVARPLIYYKNNVEGTRSLLQACLNAGVKKLIFSSTGVTYASSDKKLTEASPTLPVSPYGHSKLMAEQLLRDTCAASGMHGVILRYFNVAGADPDGRCGQTDLNSPLVISRACAAAMGDADKMFIFGTDYPTPDGTCVRDYIHVSDLAAAHLAVLEKEFDATVTTFNCGYGHGYSVKQILENFQKVTGRKLPIEYAPRRPGDAVQTVADNSALLKATDWRPQYDSLETIIGTAWDWYNKERARV
jgi:UDP-glucose 4-epimerase